MYNQCLSGIAFFAPETYGLGPICFQENSEGYTKDIYMVNVWTKKRITTKQKAETCNITCHSKLHPGATRSSADVHKVGKRHKRGLTIFIVVVKMEKILPEGLIFEG